MNSSSPRRSRRLAGLPPVSLEDVDKDVHDIKEHSQRTINYTNKSFKSEEAYFLLFMASMTMVYYFYGSFN